MTTENNKEEKSRFELIAERVGKIVTEKNKAYGNSFEESQQFLKILYPNGVPVESYNDMLCIVRIFDKLKRIATAKDAYGECAFDDILGYAILGIDIDNKRKEQQKPIDLVEQLDDHVSSPLMDEIKANNKLKSQSGGISKIKQNYKPGNRK